MKRNLIYISTFAFESQVVNLLEEIATTNYFDQINLLVSDNDKSKWNSIDRQQGAEKISYRTFKKYPNYHFYTGAQAKEFKRVFQQFLSDNTIIHIRGEFFALAVRKAVNSLKLQNVKVLSDVRGASYEETVLYKKPKFVLTKLKLYQQRKNILKLPKSSDYVSCVSERLKTYVIEGSGFDQHNIFINHCIAGNQFKYFPEIRSEYRKKLNVNPSEILFLFMTGGNSNWQNTDRIINSIAEKGYKILNLSRITFEHANVINLFVDYSEVYKYLNACDISIVWRNDDMVNNVACPIKFGEYICTGLPVVANNGVHLINEYIRSTGYGEIINDFADVDSKRIEALAAIDRNEISTNARAIFSLEIVAKGYLNTYEAIFMKNTN